MFSRLFTSPWVFSPDDLASGGGTAAPDPIDVAAAAATPAATTDTSAPASSTATPVAADTSQTGTQAPPSTPVEPAFRSIRDVGKELGYDFGNVSDDHTALQQLILRANEAQRIAAQNQQLQEMARHGQTYLQQAPEFQRWQAEQAKAAQAAEAAKQNWFKAPEWDPNWTQYLTKDADGKISAIPGAPPGVVDKFLAFTNHQRTFMERFSQNPIEAIKPGLQQAIREEAERIVQERMGAAQGNQFATGFIAQNSSWLHARDANNQLVTDFQGQPVLSPAGQRFQQHVARATELGISKGQDRAEYAYNMLKAEITAQQQTPAAQAAAAQANGDAQKAAFLAKAAGSQASAAGSQVPPTNPNTPPSLPPSGKVGHKRLAEAMAADLVAAGFKLDQPLP